MNNTLKKKLEEQVARLGEPVVIDESVRHVMEEHGISEEQMGGILSRTNETLRKAHRQRFNRQAVHQIVQQIEKNEEEKTLAVGEMLQRATRLAGQVLVVDMERTGPGQVDEQVRRLGEICEVLPEPRYLEVYVASVGEKEKGPIDGAEGQDSEEGIIQDSEERVGFVSKKLIAREQQKEVENEARLVVQAEKERRGPLIAQYAELRRRIIDINEKLVYSAQKLEFLRQVHSKAGFLFGGIGTQPGAGDSDDEIPDDGYPETDFDSLLTKFRILVEKLDYAS